MYIPMDVVESKALSGVAGRAWAIAPIVEDGSVKLRSRKRFLVIR